MKSFGLIFAAIFILSGCSTMPPTGRRPSSDQPNGQSSRTKQHYCNQYQNISFISIDGSIPATCQDFKRFDDAVSDMAHLKISRVTPTLGSIVVSVFEGWNWGQENWDANSIYMFVKANDSAWAKANEYVFGHEVGHYFLQAYVAEQEPLYQELADIKMKSLKYYKFLLPILEMRESDPSCNVDGSPCAKKIEIMVSQAPVDLKGPSGDSMVNEFKSKHQIEIENYNSVMAPYHELFADLFQSIYFSDPDINNKAFAGYALPEEPCRTFTSKLPADFSTPDPHCSLSSIRHELWQKVVFPSLAHKQKILLRIAEAIWTEAKPQLASQNNRLEPSVAAKQLLNRLLNNPSGQ
jgi:hypothetical protein